MKEDKRTVKFKNYEFKNVDSKKLECEIGIKLRELRVSNGLNQSDVGKLFNVSNRCVGKYENGDTKITIATLYDYCILFRVKLTDILPDINRMIKYDNHGK